MNKKLLFSIIGVVVLAAGMIAGILLVQRNQELRERAAPATNLSLIPGTQSIQAGQPFTLNVKMDTGANYVTAVDLDLTFNPAVFQISKIQPTSSLANFTTVITSQVDNTGGKIRYAVLNLDKTTAINGSVNILTITGNIVSTSGNGQYQFAFGPETSAAATQEGVNVVVNKTGASVTVTGGSGTGPTATATSKATATATSTSKATATATSKGTSTAKATATSTSTIKTTATATSTTAGATTAPTNPPIPETGVSLPVVAGMGIGIMAILFSLFLVF